MGSGTWSSDAYMHLRSSNNYASKSVNQIFTSSSMHKDLNPFGISFRESRDSDEHPESLAISVFLDVTGSMGRIPEIIVREKLGPLMDTIIKHGVQHPQVLFGAIGDHISDRSPLQVGQFESEAVKLAEWLTKFHLEGNGGGQSLESYLMAWLFAGRHCSIDCFEKRSQKGFLFTIGDEGVWDSIDAHSLERFLGYKDSEGVTAQQLLAEAQRTHHVFHIHINEASHRNDSKVFNQWRNLIGERFIVLDDYNAIGELIASTVAVVHGIDLKTVTSSFDSRTALVVNTALSNVGSSVAKTGSNSGIAQI